MQNSIITFLLFCITILFYGTSYAYKVEKRSCSSTECSWSYTLRPGLSRQFKGVCVDKDPTCLNKSKTVTAGWKIKRRNKSKIGAHSSTCTIQYSDPTGFYKSCTSWATKKNDHLTLTLTCPELRCNEEGELIDFSFDW